MDPLAKLPKKHPDWMAELLAEGCVASAPLPGKGDLSDWVELMEAVEALCPVWPEKGEAQRRGDWRL
jgi:hypothetical protein